MSNESLTRRGREIAIPETEGRVKDGKITAKGMREFREETENVDKGQFLNFRFNN